MMATRPSGLFILSMVAVAASHGCAADEVGLGGLLDGVNVGGFGTDAASSQGFADSQSLEGADALVSCTDAADCDDEGLIVGQCETLACDTSSGTCIVAPVADNVPCSDGNACTGESVCMSGICEEAAPIDCDNSNPCLDVYCDPFEGCISAFNLAPCDDGNACTTNDSCSEGECSGDISPACDCLVSKDCAFLEDDDLCNGSLICDAGTCVVDPGTIITCDPGLDGPCQSSTCDPATGLCALTDHPEGDPCSDDNPCTSDDVCSGGECIGQESACACEVDADCAPYNDDDLCNGSLYCDAGVCELDPMSIVTCDEAAPACFVMGCEQDTGACIEVMVADGSGCDDGDPCTGLGACMSGVCEANLLDCDDSNPCTDDSCVTAMGGCVNTPVTVYTSCDDSDPCTLEDQCALGQCTGKAKSCDDANPCTDDLCGPDGTCTHPIFEGPCDDGDPCTTADQCIIGQCLGTPEFCDDGIACTSDSCIPNVGCEHLTDDGACEGEGGCLQGVCDASMGCLQSPVQDGLTCDDGDLCTLEDVCTLGACVGAPVTCDDENPCTDDSCDPSVGCVYEPNSAPCDDGNECSTEDVCNDGKCLGTAIPGCGEPICGDGLCAVGEETCSDCPGDCGACPIVCGDGVCAPGDETCTTCPSDCGPCAPVCGDGICASPESCTTCPIDCGPCTTGSCAGSCGSSGGGCWCDSACFNLGDCCDDVCTACAATYPMECAGGGGGAICGDGICAPPETNASCPSDCPPSLFCGDGICDPTESCAICPSDCGPCAATCGDGVCDTTENTVSCPIDCVCNPGELQTCDGGCSTLASWIGDGFCDTIFNCAQHNFDGGDCQPTSTCGNGVCEPGETVSCPSDCSGGGGPGGYCSQNTACSTEVCNLDPVCCTSWDSYCDDCATTGTGWQGLNCSSALSPCAGCTAGGISTGLPPDFF